MDHLPTGLQTSMEPYKALGHSWPISEFVGSEEESAGGFYNDLDWLTTASEDRITKIECLCGLYYGDFFTLKGLRITHSTKLTDDQKKKFPEPGVLGGFGAKGDWANAGNISLIQEMPLVKRGEPGFSAERLCITAIQMTKMTVIGYDKPLSYVGESSFRLRDDVGGVMWYTPSFDKNRVDSMSKSKYRPLDGEPTLIMAPSEGRWLLRGFYGSAGAVVDRLGAIWGRDPVTKQTAEAAATSSDPSDSAAGGP